MLETLFLWNLICFERGITKPCTNFAQNGFLGWKFRKLMLKKESAFLRYHVCHFLDKTDNFEFLGPNLPKKWILGLEFKKSKFGFGISTSKIACALLFGQNGLWICRPKFGEIAKLRAIFWLEYCWGCCRELGGGWNELGGGGWNRMKLGARFSNIRFKSLKLIKTQESHCSFLGIYSLMYRLPIVAFMVIYSNKIQNQSFSSIDFS